MGEQLIGIVTTYSALQVRAHSFRPPSPSANALWLLLQSSLLPPLTFVASVLGLLFRLFAETQPTVASLLRESWQCRPHSFSAVLALRSRLR